MAPKKNLHVVPRGDKWALVDPTKSRATAVTNTQRESIDRGRQVGRNNPAGAELNIHRPNGQVRAKDSVGNASDPRKTKG